MTSTTRHLSLSMAGVARGAAVRTTLGAALGVALSVAALAALTTPLAAQGTISAQGFGYPPGQFSTRSLGTGGAIGEFDSRSPLNPAALAIGASGIELYAQYDPELRTIKGPSGTSHTTTARFPNLGIILPLGRKLVLGAGASTFLDRTWSVQSVQPQPVPDTVNLTNTLKSQGGITDLRFGAGYAFNRYIRVGVAGHYFSGSNSIQLLQQFPDTLTFGNISQTTTLNFGGTAVSAGAEVDLPFGVSLAASGRIGNEIRMSIGDTLISKANVPDHYAASVGYTGIPGTFVAVRYGVDRWKSMEPLSTAGATAVETNDLSVGVESTGPHSGSQAIIVRLGARFRTLPFQVDGVTVKERSFGGGAGLPIGRGRAVLDLAVLHSTRTGVAGVTESAFNLSFGLRIHP